jgi:hypothetical protein
LIKVGLGLIAFFLVVSAFSWLFTIDPNVIEEASSRETRIRLHLADLPPLTAQEKVALKICEDHRDTRKENRYYVYEAGFEACYDFAPKLDDRAGADWIRNYMSENKSDISAVNEAAKEESVK